MVCTVQSLGLHGVSGYPVSAACALSGGLPAFDIVGLPDAALKESRDRVHAAVKNCGFDFPMRRITVNLAPGEMRKEGPVYVLPILVGLVLWNQLPERMTTHWGVDGQPDGWSSKAFAVFAMPILLVAMQFFCVWITDRTNRGNEQSPKVMNLIFCIMPVLSLLTNGMVYALALGKTWEMSSLMPLIMGALFALVGNYPYQSISNTNWNIGKYNWSDAATITLSLSIPLYKAGNFTSIKTNKIQQQQLAETRINTERMLNMQAQSFVDNMSASAEQLQSNKAAVELAEKGLEISQKRYDVGKGTILELTNSQVSLTNTRLSYNNTIYDYLVAKSDLNKVLGKE